MDTEPDAMDSFPDEMKIGFGGIVFVSNTCTIIPKLHISTLQEYPFVGAFGCVISGAANSSVPKTVVIREWKRREHPKSAITRRPPGEEVVRRMFSG